MRSNHIHHLVPKLNLGTRWHVIEELSGYLDGEARHPEAIAEHLKACPECTERYEALRRLSAQVKALPVPEVRPEFVTRVVACVAEQRETARPGGHGSWTRFALPLATMAALALVVGVVLYMNVMTAPMLPKTAQAPAITDKDALIAKMAAINTVEGIDVPGAEDDEAVPAEDLLAALSDHEWFDSFAGTWDEDEDLDTLIDSLNDAERQMFTDLVHEYAQEDTMS